MKQDTRVRLRNKVAGMLTGKSKNSIAPRWEVCRALKQEFLDAGLPEDDHWYFVANVITWMED